MSKKLFSNDFFISVIIILALIFLHHTTLIYPLERVITWILSPFQIIAYSAGDNLSNTINTATKKQNFQSENETLRKKIENLEDQIVTLKSFIEENKLLEEESDYLKARKINFQTARVIGRGPDSNANILIINKGWQNGLQNGLAVMAEKGALIGKIIRTEQNQSFVLLLIDNQCRLSASLAGQSEITGVVSGSHNNSLILDYVLKNNALKTGDLIVTAGTDNAIPAGLLIGEVGEITDNKEDLFKQAEIISPSNFKNLKIVSVIIN